MAINQQYKQLIFRNNNKYKVLKSLINNLVRGKSLPFINLIGQKINKRTFINNPFMPIKAQIEPTTKCNLTCLTCSRSTYSKDMIGDLSYYQFKKIIDDIPTLLFVKLQGMGEPYLNKQIVDMLKYSKDKFIITEVISNGTIINNESLKYLDSLIFSIDGGTRNTFEKMRPGANFDKVVLNIREVVNARKNTIVGMTIVVSKETVNELNDFVDLAVDIGVDYVAFPLVEQWVVKNKVNIEKWNEINCLMVDVKKQITDAEKYASSFGLGIRSSPKKYWIETCVWPWESVFITYNGYVTPCCIRPDWRVKNFGNILITPFREIWNNHDYREFRKSIKYNQPSIICMNCPDGI